MTESKKCAGCGRQFAPKSPLDAVCQWCAKTRNKPKVNICAKCGEPAAGFYCEKCLQPYYKAGWGYVPSIAVSLKEEPA